jgi:ATP-dependent helicase/DNAse subunit B
VNKINVPVFFSCDDNYIPFLGVAIKSLIENSSKENNYFVFVLHSKMSIKNMKIITAMEKENAGEFVPKFSEKSPSDSFIKEEDFNNIFQFIENKLQRTGRAIYEGDIAADPVDGLDSGACKYCEYKSVCRIGEEPHKQVPKLTNQEVLKEIERQVSDDGI